jgi:glycosyltransferase involved in cell wall biosynthesis
VRTLLVLNFFPAVVPPRSGGEQRYYHLWAALSRFYDITLLSPTYPEHAAELVNFRPTFREYRIPKERLHVQLHRRMDRDGTGPECSALVCALASADDDAYRRKYRELVAGADAVVHESPYMLNYDEAFGRDGKPRIYDSYNVEARLAAYMFPGMLGRPYVRFIEDLERQLACGSDLVLATSEIERRAFHERYGCPEEALALAPNGFRPAPMSAIEPGGAAAGKRRFGMDPGQPLAIFVGSAHPPNIEAACFIRDRLAPALPSVQFGIAGSVCDAVASELRNLHRLGVLDDDDKARLYRACDVALNPVVSGAGTNLKLLEYLGAGLAVVTTPFGARGIPVEHRRHAIVVDPDAFAAGLDELLGDHRQREALGRAATDLAHTRFTWAAIADAMRMRIDTLFQRQRPKAAAARGRLLLLNDFPISSAVHGGAVRVRELFTRLSAHYDLTLLCLCDDATTSQVHIADGFTELRVPKTSAHRIKERKWNGRDPVSVSDVVNAAMCADNAELVAHYRRLLGQSDVLILEHPYLVALLDVERPRIPVIYEAHNVETVMKTETLSGHPARSPLLTQIAAIEARACDVADRIICVSPEDREMFARRVDPAKLAVVRNAVDTKPYLGQDRRPTEIADVFQGRPVAIFLGSAHPPNLEGVRFIVEELAPRHPAVVFVVVGGAGESFRQQAVPANVLLCGVVSEREKQILLTLADVALNPMRSGGGSSLKVAEYLAAGVPVLSTGTGLRGYDLYAEDHVAIADLPAFSDQLTALLSHPEWRAQLQRNGQREARANLDWDLQAATYREVIDGVRAAVKRRLLVSTFRFTDPPRGGAETYLLHVLRHLHATGRFIIDVATFDVEGITDHFHFSARYGRGGHATPSFVNHVYGFRPEPLPGPEAFDRCRRLFAMWHAEDLVQARRAREELPGVVLLGGWHVPERHAEGLRRWTGGDAEIHCPAHVRAVTMSGFAHGETPITVSMHDRVLHTGVLRGRFSLHVDLGETAPGILLLQTPALSRSPDDPRPLGICVTDLTEISGTGPSPVPLDRDFATHWRASDPEGWVASLIDVTRQRDVAEDSLFLAVRGPSARAFEDWLGANVTRYDLVLAHGAPFAPAVITAKHAYRRRVPYAMLPHYHFDDKYYHWQSDYEALTGADLVFASPDRAKAYFFDKIGAHAVCLPGGVDPDEFIDLEACVDEFRRLHRSSRPFILVLGRKAGGKRYERVVHAVDALCARGQACDVVMIGADEDGFAIASDTVRCYGTQSRRVVLGALASCTASATMSESESFGIVIVEAWMCRKPVIANRHCAAFAELVEHEVDGLLCGTDDEVVSAMSRLLAEPELCRRLGARGYEKAVARFTWRQIGDAIGHALLSIAR